MEIFWNEEKNDWLLANRAISFHEIAEKIINGDIIEILENPGNLEQYYFILKINKYTWVIPFIIDDQDNVFLKTAFPSRKFHKIYGDHHETD